MRTDQVFWKNLPITSLTYQQAKDLVSFVEFIAKKEEKGKRAPA